MESCLQKMIPLPSIDHFFLNILISFDKEKRIETSLNGIDIASLLEQYDFLFFNFSESQKKEDLVVLYQFLLSRKLLQLETSLFIICFMFCKKYISIHYFIDFIDSFDKNYGFYYLNLLRDIVWLLKQDYQEGFMGFDDDNVLLDAAHEVMNKLSVRLLHEEK